MLNTILKDKIGCNEQYLSEVENHRENNKFRNICTC